jgi:UDP-glucose 4-epimerase
MIIRPDGTSIRDYVHVSDLADAHVAAIEWLSAGNPSDSFNLGNGRGFSVADVVRTSEKVTGRPVKTEMCVRRAGDPPILVSDSSKARQVMGWAPKFAALDQQIMHAWTWFREIRCRISRACEMSAAQNNNTEEAHSVYSAKLAWMT